MDKTEIEIKIKEIHDKISPSGMSSREKDEIIEELDSILYVDPDNIEAYFLKAMTYDFTSDYANAIKMYEEVLRLDPNRELVPGQIKACKIMLETQSILEEDVSNKSNTSTNYAESKSFMQNISIWYILIFKVIVIALLVYYLFIPIFTGN